jgi:hypothetical protein
MGPGKTGIFIKYHIFLPAQPEWDPISGFSMDGRYKKGCGSWYSFNDH